MFIYNEDHSIEFQGTAPQAVLDIMKDDPKQFFHYEMQGTQVILLGLSRWQNW